MLCCISVPNLDQYPRCAYGILYCIHHALLLGSPLPPPLFVHLLCLKLPSGNAPRHVPKILPLPLPEYDIPLNRVPGTVEKVQVCVPFLACSMHSGKGLSLVLPHPKRIKHNKDVGLRQVVPCANQRSRGQEDVAIAELIQKLRFFVAEAVEYLIALRLPHSSHNYHYLILWISFLNDFT